MFLSLISGHACPLHVISMAEALSEKDSIELYPQTPPCKKPDDNEVYSTAMSQPLLRNCSQNARKLPPKLSNLTSSI